MSLSSSGLRSLAGTPWVRFVFAKISSDPSRVRLAKLLEAVSIGFVRRSKWAQPSDLPRQGLRPGPMFLLVLNESHRRWQGEWRQSGLMLALRITAPHFAVSSAISLPYSAGEPPSGMPLISARRPLILESANPALISRFKVSITSAGVSLGAATPNHELAS